MLNQRGAKAAITQTFRPGDPGNPKVTFLASHSGTGAATAFAELRSAVAACPATGSGTRNGTVQYEDLDGPGYPEDTIRIRMTITEEGSDEPADISERIVARVGVCIVDMTGMGPEPYPRLADEPLLRQIKRLQSAQGL
ncbi:hypothetical protein ACFWUZ_26410 [Streptomyces sp. NPDC058646]|uniref:hypothetical protein n=1 Tax=Streptomyces sp. NPDC058646 TaxID=3346574 RepID=UPI00365A56E2